MKKPIISLVCLAIIQSACTVPAPTTKVADNLNQGNQGKAQTLTVLGINDFHGNLAPRKAKSMETDPTTAVTYETGGASAFASYVDVAKKVYGNQLLILDAGDEWQGTLESNTNQGAAVVDFFNLIGLHAAAIGNHEFDFGFGKSPQYQSDLRGAMNERFSEAKYPYLSANITHLDGATLFRFNNHEPSVLLSVGGIQVGVIGLTTTSTSTTTNPIFVPDLKFTSLKEATLREASALRNKGAEVILIVAHAGSDCQASKKRQLWGPLDQQGECGKNDEMTQLLATIPAGTVDGVIAGHTHQVIHHWIHGVPVMEGGAYNQYFNLMHLPISPQTRKVIAPDVRIDGPIAICPKIFQNQGDCDGKAPAPEQGRGPLVTPEFLGHSLLPVPQVEAKLAALFQETETTKKRIIGSVARAITHTRVEESELGNVVTDAMKASIPGADFAITNGGGIRLAGWESGPMTYGTLFETLPFDNFVCQIQATGAQVRKIMQIAFNGSKGLFSISGLRIKLKKERTPVDYTGDGTIEPWEYDRIEDLVTSQDQPLVPEKTYLLLANDFLCNGGDDWIWVMKQLPPHQVRPIGGGFLRDVVESYLVKNSPLNTEANPVIDKKAPRIIFSW